MNKETKEFFQKLANLLEEYKAEIYSLDVWTGYAECGQDLQISFELPNEYSSDLMMGDYVDADKIREEILDKTNK